MISAFDQNSFLKPGFVESIEQRPKVCQVDGIRCFHLAWNSLQDEDYNYCTPFLDTFLEHVVW